MVYARKFVGMEVAQPKDVVVGVPVGLVLNVVQNQENVVVLCR
tara:strand:+ start:856 stop:984 length:129 start_codon:yes stop_codon:yes gene_type:complete